MRLVRITDPQPGRRLLDVGCGNGAAPIHLARTVGLDVTGIDSREDLRRIGWPSCTNGGPQRVGPLHVRARVRVVFGPCSDVFPDQATKREEMPAKSRADARIRTADPFITSEVLYQLSYVGGRGQCIGLPPGPTAP